MFAALCKAFGGLGLGFRVIIRAFKGFKGLGLGFRAFKILRL